MKIALVGCGSSKKDESAKAKDLYTSNYFKLKKDYAESQCDDWYILSAEHYLLPPSREISPYDTHIDEVDQKEWSSLTKAKLAWAGKLTEDDTVVVLAGQKYVELIEDWLEFTPAQVERPFDETSGIGEQMAWLKGEINGDSSSS